MKKAAILTITNSGMNFGNRLQNFALQEIVERLGVSCETIESAKSVGNTVFLSGVRRKIKKVVKNDSRRRKFNEFNRNYIHFADRVRYEGLNEECFKDEYDLFIAGSDQIWNPYFEFNSEFEYMTFADPQKRFSYAASFGIDALDAASGDNVRECLNGLKEISVREDKGKENVCKMTGREASVHVEPTMLLRDEEYRQMEQEPEGGLPEHYMLIYFLGDVIPEYRKYMEKLAAKRGLPIVELSESVGTKYYGIGPAEFMYFIDHADYVCTDSFHGTVFSILFGKQFMSLQRRDKDKPMSSRLDTLLRKFGLEDRRLEVLAESEADPFIDYTEVYAKLEHERAVSMDYLKTILWDKKRLDCTGCGACAAKCPKKCITMQADAEGFLYPVKDMSVCNGCGLCDRVCHARLNYRNGVEQILGAISENEEERRVSSSGGIFSLLAKEILGRGGVVYGAAFNRQFSVEHIRIDCMDDLGKIQGSKYVQSVIGTTYIDCERDLKDGKPVLFSGTPCQIAGLKSFLGRDYENLYGLDVFCHGVPSDKVWQKYLRELKIGRVNRVAFRNKDNGWRGFSLVAEGSDGAHRQLFEHDYYGRAFISNISLRPSCGCCDFKRMNSCADITLGDFWGAEKEFLTTDNWGKSVVFLHTSRGRELWQCISSSVKSGEIVKERMMVNNDSAYFGIRVHSRRKEFFDQLDSRTFKYLVDRYVRGSMVSRVCRKVKQKAGKR